MNQDKFLKAHTIRFENETIYDKVADDAKKAKRSINKQILLIIEEYYTLKQQQYAMQVAEGKEKYGTSRNNQQQETKNT